MEIIKPNADDTKIEVGDVVLSTKRKYYLLVKVENGDIYYPFIFIDLETMKNVNGWRDLSGLNNGRYVTTGENIVKVYKGNNLRLELERSDRIKVIRGVEDGF